MNSDRKKAYDKNYYESNKERLRAQDRQRKLLSKEQTSLYQANYRKANKEALAAHRKDYSGPYNKARRASDPSYKLIGNITRRHGKVLKGTQSTSKGLGCTSEELRAYIEAQWTEGMSWDNYGKEVGQWSLDHKLPLSLYYTQPEILPQLIHYTNMQPMWHIDNIKKSNKIISR